MYSMKQKDQLESMMKRPIPKKKVGIVHLEMVKESRCLYGMDRLTDAGRTAEMVRPLLEKADREMVVVVSLDTRMMPMAVEIVSVGGIDACMVDVKNIFKHAILNNSSYIMCIHNHPSGCVQPSREDDRLTERLRNCGMILGIRLVDHMILGENRKYYSYREEGKLVVETEEDAA